MAENKKQFVPSPEQRRVLDSVGKNMLVSASAGTGKTTVMIQKIAGLIKSRKAALKEILVVTFTDMAAYEMKKRLVKELSVSQDREILSQLSYIDTCDISTLHSFCSSLIRRYFVDADIDPAYKILMGAERDIAFGAAVERVFRRHYLAGDGEFTDLVEIFGWGRSDDNVKSIIGELYSFMSCKHDAGKWLEETRERYAVRDGENFYTKALNAEICGVFADIRRRMDGAAAAALSAGLEKDALYMSDLAASVTVSDKKNLESNLAEIRAMSFPPLPKLASKDADDARAAAHGLCGKVKTRAAEAVKRWAGALPDAPYPTLLKQAEDSEKLCEKLFELTLETAEEYEKYKKQNAFLDFNDLEHKALKVLSSAAVAEEVRGQYKYVFVDEYQDINEIQEAIISLVKGENNTFMVGDVKQSIYAFRQCAPDIFVDKINRFEREADLNRVEYLNRNYRSDRDILRFVNGVFSAIMTEEFGGVDYSGKSRLEGESALKGGAAAVTLDMIAFDGAKETPAGVYDPKNPPAAPFGKAAAEAKVIADEIRGLIGLVCEIDGVKRPLTYGDMVILCRDSQSHTRELVSRLREAGLPVNFSSPKDALASAEIKALVNLLRLADNRYQDLPLVACMTGFAGDFTDGEAAEIFGEKGENLWLRMEEYVRAHDNETTRKAEKFMTFVKKTAFLAQSLPVHKLLAWVLDATDFSLRVLGLPDGETRMKNVNVFCDSLKDAPYNRSVSEFIGFADGADSAAAELPSMAKTDAVRVMTIHKSKGLEFPVVFISNCGKAFRFRPGGVICDKKYGFAAKAYDVAARVASNTVPRVFLESRAETKMKEEEMRLLYVAMTRAKCHLFMTGCHEAGKEGDGSYFQWIERAAAAMPDGVCVKKVIAADRTEEPCAKGRREFAYGAFDDKTASEIKRRAEWKYSHAAATTMELKAVSSNLKPYQRAGEDETDFVPVVIDAADAPANVTGTAYHKVFEKIDFRDRTLDNARGVIDRLAAEGEIAPETAASLSPEFVLKVISLPVFDGLENKKVYRELPFMLKTKYSNLFDDKNVDENIFLQGVIDMLIVDGDTAAVVDYKYSRNGKYLKERYDKQLESYAEAVRQILKIDKVDKYIVSVADGSVIKM